jgi:hypothetical protein
VLCLAASPGGGCTCCWVRPYYVCVVCVAGFVPTTYDEIVSFAVVVPGVITPGQYGNSHLSVVYMVV